MKVTVGVDLAWRVAAHEAKALLQERIQPEHLLFGLLSLEREAVLHGERQGLSGRALKAVLAEADVLKGALAPHDPAALAKRLRLAFTRGHTDTRGRPISRSPRCKAAFERAAKLGVATAPGLLAELLADPGETLEALLKEPGVAWSEVAAKAQAQAIVNALIGQDDRETGRRAAKAEDPAPDGSAAPTRGSAAPTRGSALERFGRDLTSLAKEGKLRPVIGRRKVLLQVLQTLARATKNNVVLVGEAGVGKTAIVEALAQRAAAGKDPKVLGGKRIVELQVGALVAGSKMRGEFEQRLELILAEAKRDPSLIVFIDELHTVIGAGRAEGGADAAQLLKPALARGDFRCIGATTVEEFRKHIESDAALERRFERVTVPEPSPDETVEILRGLKAGWEKHHGVSIEDSALEAAVELSIRFDAAHRLPDKAIDLVDRAGARAVLPDLSMGPGGKSAAPARKDSPSPGARGGSVRAEDVAEVVAEKLGVPVELARSHLGGAGVAARLKVLMAFLKKALVGQDDAIERVCGKLLSAHAGLSERRGPLGVFLFLGPSGVGKTELARLISQGLTGSDDALIRLDMSEFMEEHSVAKLIGSPPGYVGHDEGGRLTGRLRTTPYAVVLLDEVEKAHPRVLDLFLQVFDAGRLTDSKGREADARDAVFIMTSNLGPGSAPAKAPIGFGERAPLKDASSDDPVRRFFRPELLNRIDDRIVFRALERADAERVLARVLKRLEHELHERYDAELEVTTEARELLLHEGYSHEYGVRALEREVERRVREPLAALAADGKAKGAHLRAGVEGGAVVLRRV